MDNNKMRKEFEASPKFRGMDFTRSPTHPDYYESPYANGAWDGWKASREAVVVALPRDVNLMAPTEVRDMIRNHIEAQGLRVLL